MKRILMILAIVLILMGGTSSCKKDDVDLPDIDFSNIENLYAQPLPVIQKCVEGKWKWYVSYGGLAGANYSDNTFINIKEDNYVIDYEDGSQRTWYFKWEKYNVTGIGQTYVMWDEKRNEAGWYFVSIKNDTLMATSSIPTGPDIPCSFGFVRVK